LEDEQLPTLQHANTPDTDTNHSPVARSSSRLIQALDLADDTLHVLAEPVGAVAKLRANPAAGNSRHRRPARLPVNVTDSSTPNCPARYNHSSDSRRTAQQNSALGSKPAEACQQQQQQVSQLHGGGQGDDGALGARLQWEADAVHAVSQALAAAGLPATALVSGAGPREAADILTVMSAAAAAGAAVAGADYGGSAAVGNACREEVQQLHSMRAAWPQSSSGSTDAQNSAAWHATHTQPTPPAAAAPDSSSNVSSRSIRPGSAPCAMQPLAAWQLKLAELEAACRNAEQLKLQAPTRAERSAALDLAGEPKMSQCNCPSWRCKGRGSKCDNWQWLHSRSHVDCRMDA
jgi:hypothetical protein